MKVQEVGWVRLLLTKEASMPSRLRSRKTNSPNRSSPTLPSTLEARPRRTKSAAALAAHPPTLRRYLSMADNSPAAGSESSGLAKMSATNNPREMTSAISMIPRIAIKLPCFPRAARGFSYTQRRKPLPTIRRPCHAEPSEASLHFFQSRSEKYGDCTRAATRLRARASRPLGGAAHMPNDGMYAPPARNTGILRFAQNDSEVLPCVRPP